jgi:RimJ/RimL family protein N-acetyltransferase
VNVSLTTTRLRLREFTAADAPLLFQLDADPEVLRYIGQPLADEEAYRQRICQRFLPYYASNSGHGYWAAELSDAQFIGWFHLRPSLDGHFAQELEFGPGELEIGYRLRRAHWGRGYATEGSQALLRRAFLELKAPWVVASALAGNRASIRVMQKIGLRCVGEFALPGYEQPAVKYALSRADYLSMRTSVEFTPTSIERSLPTA